MSEAMYDLVYLLEHVTLTMLYIFLILCCCKYIRRNK